MAYTGGRVARYQIPEGLTIMELIRVPAGEHVVAMTKHKDEVIIATQKHIYLLTKNYELQRIIIENKDH